jgi:hypothetical protein
MPGGRFTVPNRLSDELKPTAEDLLGGQLPEYEPGQGYIGLEEPSLPISLANPENIGMMAAPGLARASMEGIESIVPILKKLASQVGDKGILELLVKRGIPMPPLNILKSQAGSISNKPIDLMEEKLKNEAAEFLARKGGKAAVPKTIGKEHSSILAKIKMLQEKVDAGEIPEPRALGGLVEPEGDLDKDIMQALLGGLSTGTPTQEELFNMELPDALKAMGIPW